MKESTKSELLSFGITTVFCIALMIVTKLICPSMPDWAQYIMLLMFCLFLGIKDLLIEIKEELVKLRESRN